MGGGVASVREGMLEFRLSVLLGSLLPSCFSSPLLSELSPWFSSWTLCPGFLCRNCSSRSWFCFVRRSTAAARVWNCLSNAVGLGGSSLWTTLVVAIERVSTMQLLCPGGDNGLNCHDQPSLRRRQLMMPKSSPVRCTILALVVVAYKREQHKNTLQKAPVWSRPNTLRRLNQKSFYNSRVLEKSQSRVPFYEEDVGAFYSSEVLPPFLVEQVLSLQSKSSPCRASLILAEQVSSL